jgi:hypothetical protein
MIIMFMDPEDMETLLMAMVTEWEEALLQEQEMRLEEEQLYVMMVLMELEKPARPQDNPEEQVQKRE